MKQKPIESWMKQNSWNLLVTIVSIIIAFTIAQQRINALEIKVDQYPSYDYFELKFNTLEKNIEELKNTLNGHMGIQ